MSSTILWHDYETWGIRPSVDFPVQFAAIRTDLDLNIIETSKAINWMCAIPHDYLPHPQACLVTGITPSFSMRKGMSEPNFAKKIHAEMSVPETCVAGYNSIRFDEEVSRHLFFRNFYPVYEREYANGNSRWDIIDLVRAAYALRPEGINWPMSDEGLPIFKLEQLSNENSIEHVSAHDALSDVYATIAMAKLIKEKQPKLYEYYWKLRSKHEVDKLLGKFQQTILVYISAYIGSKQGCCTLIMPICRHPHNNNSVICVDLNNPIDDLLSMTALELRESIFKRFDSKQNDDDTKANKLRLFTVAINKCPFVAPLNTLSENNAERLGIDLARCRQNYAQIASIQTLTELCQSVYKQEDSKPIPNNIDECLYATDFPSDADKMLTTKVRASEPEQLIAFQGGFENEHYNSLLFRYRGRNFPFSLEEHEIRKWQQYLQMRFYENNKRECLSLQEYFVEIETLMSQFINVPDKLRILQALKQHGNAIADT